MATYNQMQVQQKPKFSVAITTKGYQSLISNTLRDPARVPPVHGQHYLGGGRQPRPRRNAMPARFWPVGPAG